MPSSNDSYLAMWESFGKTKSAGLMTTKFQPTHRIGLTNFLREAWIFRLLPIGPDDVFGDIGCASGRQVFLAARRAKEAYGTDIAASFIEYANAQKESLGVANAFFGVAPVENLPFAAASFDRLVCSEVLEHVLDLPAALAELRRVVRPGGLALVTVPNLNADGTLWGRLLRRLGRRSFTPITSFTMQDIESHGDAHVREFTVRSLGETLDAAGFEPVRATTVSMLDGWDRGITLLLRIPPLRALIVAAENLCSHLGLPFGRHIVLLCRRRLAENASIG